MLCVNYAHMHISPLLGVWNSIKVLSICVTIDSVVIGTEHRLYIYERHNKNNSSEVNSMNKFHECIGFEWDKERLVMQ